VSPVQRNRHAALLRASGYEDAPALTVQSTDGEIPHGRELSFAWLTGTVMTGLTSVLLMGAALYVSFQGQDTFSTAYEALQIVNPETEGPDADSATKTDRVRPVARTRSELEIVEASIRENVDGRDMIRKQPFVRIRATLATGATALSEDVPPYDPVAILDANQPIQTAEGDDAANPEIYGTDVEGEVSIKLAAMPISLVPARAISDKRAADFVRLTVENLFGGDGEAELLAYAPEAGTLRELGVVPGGAGGVAENVTIMPKTTVAEDGTLGRSERILSIREAGPLADTLLKNGFTEQMVAMVGVTLKNVLPSMNVPKGARLRILFGASRSSDKTLIPYRVSIYFPDPKTGEIEHAATAALTDRGTYVLGLAPTEIEFPDEDTEEINVANLPSVYRSIWETARKHDLDDATTRRIVAMYAYDVDMTKKISAGDSIEILQTEPGADGQRELLYVGLKLGSTMREFYRFRTNDGTVDYYDPAGETGKRFLTRRPIEGGGRLASRFGMRQHPIFKSRRMHTGIDLAARTGTPIYASGDGIVQRAGWVSGYGKKVELRHVNGFETGYGHMSRIADGLAPGTRVRQGQIIGYVGSTGNSTGPHLHFEILVNGRVVDPLSVKLPRDKSLAAQYQSAFAQTIEQIRDLMQREPAPMTVAAVN
jgi:murein DD-endopeptidase MepM/ murein hydrolase activator NlpD